MVAYLSFITILCLVLLLGICLLLYRGNYLTKALVKLGIKEATSVPNWSTFSWINCLEKLDYDADMVFFGDSITRGSDFRAYFPDKRIVNLGCSGDTLSGMLSRLPMVKALSPKQIFILGGINGLTDRNIDKCILTYSRLLNQLRTDLPHAQIYVQSILPLSPQKEKSICKNETICTFNQKLHDLANELHLSFIDTHSLYVKDGCMDPSLTVDGIHLRPEAYGRWAELLRTHIDEQASILS